VTQDRGKPLESELAPWVMVTVHPSSILRARGDDERTAAYRAFVDDLRAVAAHLDD
jgi:DNA polymerase